MRILVVGSGGREHALVKSFSQSNRVSALFAAPGNPGTAQQATNVDLEATDLDGLVEFAKSEDIDLTLVGPERPLVDGLVNRFEAAGLPIVGPTETAAQLEGSKAFADQFMARHDVPTASFRVFDADERDEAAAHLSDVGAPVVVKADGLAGGKGAFVCSTLDEAHDALDEIVQRRAFGGAGDRVVIEEKMEGEEVSVLALTDGAHYVLLPPSQDHKPIGEGGTGPNTGGMGAFAPAPIVDGTMLARICREIIEPTLQGMQAEGTPYRGVLYCGLMITEEGPKVVEYNCRLGDPEAQVVLPLVESDLAAVFQNLADGDLQGHNLRTASGAAACVVLASDGYPIEYETGVEIGGVGEAEALEDASVIHAGTRLTPDGTLVTGGGRVLGVTATGRDLPAALGRAYDGVDRVEFEGKTYRRDIGEKGLGHLNAS
ncbi:phosphoribosylamine--glycine ligase [Salinibacter altiplanensis]|uniref:phosphoribosylamine--glycine ligase n=1 Tax=Salinibacter altiplanensis TaxID=1803181 RepID=UPI000C9FEF66|nr:phosphoribosylamine--glycine ligase [Salinibacter altiplanensis]